MIGHLDQLIDFVRMAVLRFFGLHTLKGRAA